MLIETNRVERISESVEAEIDGKVFEIRMCEDCCLGGCGIDSPDSLDQPWVLESSPGDADCLSVGGGSVKTPCGPVVGEERGGAASPSFENPGVGLEAVVASFSRVPESGGATALGGRLEEEVMSKFELKGRSAGTTESDSHVLRESVHEVQEAVQVEDDDCSSWAQLVRKGGTEVSKGGLGVRKKGRGGSYQSREGLSLVVSRGSRGQSLISSSGVEKPVRGAVEDLMGLSEKQINILKMARRKEYKEKKVVKYQTRKKLREERAKQIVEDDLDQIENSSGNDEAAVERERRRLQREEAKETYRIALKLGVKGILPEDDMIQIFEDRIEKEQRERCS